VNTVQQASTIRDVEWSEVQTAGEVLAKAFRGYPFFEYCLGDADNYDRMAPGMFASFVRWTMLYGKAWMTNDLNAVALRQPPGTRSIGLWNALRVTGSGGEAVNDTKDADEIWKVRPCRTRVEFCAGHYLAHLSTIFG
jgi:hypothetical protein